MQIRIMFKTSYKFNLNYYLNIYQYLIIFFAVIITDANAGQNLSIRSMVEVSMNSESGFSYQLQSSNDLTNWINEGSPNLHNAGKITRYFPLNQSRQFYRVVSNSMTDISGTLESIRSTYNVPALGCIVISNGKIAALNVVGTRKDGVNVPATSQDQWHQGSITKSMTATLAAIMVGEGSISWNSTLGQIFPEKVNGMASGWSNVTLEQLLTNTSGAPSQVNSNQWNTLWNFQGTPRDARQLLIEIVTSSPPSFIPGTNFTYSNQGFGIAGAMLEKAANTAWEDLITEKLFRPLGMDRTSFGAPGAPRHIFQPWGHSRINGINTPIAPGTDADNPPAIGPGATVHAPLMDLAKYMQLHLSGARGEQTALLNPSLFSKIHKSIANNNYAMGWNVVERSWAGGLALTHGGANTYWYSTMWIAPAKNWACVAVTNYGATDAFTAVDSTIWAMVQRFGLSN